jgi:hypothetical protein
MIKIFKLTNGNEIIGEVSDEELTSNEFYNIMNPMLIIGADDDYGYGGMRLRDALLLSDEELLTVPVKHCIMFYNPSKVFREYYEVASVHYRSNTKKDIEEQIREATADLVDTLKGTDRRVAKSLQDILTKLGEGPKGKLN